MSIKRITISVPDRVATRIRQAARGTAVSSWVAGVIEEHLDDAELERQWQQFYKDVSPSAQAMRQGRTLFNRLTKRRRGRAAA